MRFNEGDIVYACINGIPTQCKLTALEFGGPNIHLATTMPAQQSYIVNSEEIAETAEICLKEFQERAAKEYALYDDLLDSPTALILHLLHASVNGRKIIGLERQAIINKSEKYTQIDVNEYLAKLDEIEKGKNKNYEEVEF